MGQRAGQVKAVGGEGDGRVENCAGGGGGW